MLYSIDDAYSTPFTYNVLFETLEGVLNLF